jgi:hypothetical protein
MLSTIKAGAVLASPKSSSLAIGGAEVPLLRTRKIARLQVAVDDPMGTRSITIGTVSQIVLPKNLTPIPRMLFVTFQLFASPDSVRWFHGRPMARRYHEYTAICMRH